MRALAIVLLISACAHRRERVVTVPKTPEAMKCFRECMLISTTCEAGHGPDETPEGKQFRCGKKQQACLLTCPGAQVELR